MAREVLVRGEGETVAVPDYVAVRVTGRAVHTSALEVIDFQQLGELLAELVDAGAAVAGLSWELR